MTSPDSQIQRRAAALTHPLSSIFPVSAEVVPIWDYEGADGQVPRQNSMDVLMYGVCVCGWRLRDDCLAAACSFNPALSLPPSPALN